MLPPYDFDDIEDYVSGQMTAEDRSAFEKILEEDPNLQASVLAYQKEAEAIKHLRRVALREKFAAWKEHDSLPPTAPAAGSSVKKWLYWILPLFLILSAAVLYFRFFYTSIDQPALPPVPITSIDTVAYQDTLSSLQQTFQSTQAVNWKKLSSATHRNLLKIEYFMGATKAAILTDSIFGLLAKRQSTEALSIALNADTSESQVQLCLAHIYWTQQDYQNAAIWYAALKNNNKNLRFQIDAEINEMACYMALQPQRRAKLKEIIRHILQTPDEYPLTEQQKNALNIAAKSLR